jgi:aryl-alcohol dehydrogenase-like predicted oxidoreductase
MSGGINHVDTGSQFRNQNSERVVGQVLKTLQEKYRIDRSQFFISSKQGFTSYDEEYDIPREIEIQELI